MAELAAQPGVRVASQPGSKALLDEDHPASLDRLIPRRASSCASHLHNPVAGGIICRVTKNNARIVGVGMVPFKTPSRSESYDVMGVKAAVVTLADAGIDYRQVQHSYAGYVYGHSTSGQAALYGLGQTGIPIVDVNHACATGSSALFLARQAVESGALDCVLALGFEQMQRGGLGTHWSDRPTPFDRFDDVMHAVQGQDESPFAAQYFGGARRQYVSKYGIAPETFAKISVKACPAVARIRTVRSGRESKRCLVKTNLCCHVAKKRSWS